ncbi:MAG: hypothetical protein IJS65_02060 [Clostridia bacterium]|nr:hypothetical protein [Clostridia bacterium]
MKKSKKWLLLIPAALIIALAVIVISNLPLIKTFYGGLKYVGKDTDAIAVEKDAVISEKTEEITGVKIGKLTDEQNEALKSGELSEQEAIDIILGRTNAENSTAPAQSGGEASSDDPAQTAAPTPEQPEQTAPAQPAQSGEAVPAPPVQTDPQIERIQELVATVYVCKSTFSNRVDEILTQAKKEYSAIPEGQRTRSKINELVSKYADEASKLETECDKRVDEIAGELSTLLSETGNDPSVAEDIKTAYAIEKDAKKAYYINLYKSKLNTLF